MKATFLATAGGLCRQGKARDYIFPLAIPEEKAAEFLTIWANTEQHYLITPMNEEDTNGEDVIGKVKQKTHIMTPANKFHASYANDKRMREFLHDKTGYDINSDSAAHDALVFYLKLESLSEMTQTQLNRVVRECYGED